MKISREGMSDNEYRMATKSMPSLIFFNSLPPIIGMFVNALYNVVDRYWVGQMGGKVGEAGITSIGLTAPLTIILLGLCQLVGIGAATRISISLGEKKKELAEKILGNTLFSSVAISILYTIIVMAFKVPLLKALGTDETTFMPANQYITIIIMGCMFQVISFAMNHPIRATGNSLRFAMTQMIGAFANMILDPIFIFTFDMGIEGAAYATVLAQAISAALAVSYYFSKKSELRLKAKNIIPDMKILLSIASIGFSPFVMQVAGSMLMIILNKTLYFYSAKELGDGNIALASMTIINGVFMLFFMPILGINQGSQPIIGFNYGMKDYKRVTSSYKWSVIYSMIICTIGFIVVEIFAQNFIEMFKPSKEVVAFGTYGIRIYFITMFALGFQVPTVNFFQSIGRAKLAVFLSLLRQVALLAPMYIILPRIFGLNGIFVSVPIADYVSSVVTAIFVIKELKDLKITLKEA